MIKKQYLEFCNDFRKLRWLSVEGISCKEKVRFP